MKKTDPIVTEVRRVRDEHAQRFNYDLDAIVEDLKKGETADREHGVTYVSTGNIEREIHGSDSTPVRGQ